MTPVLVKHDYGCSQLGLDVGHSDSAKRMADWYNLHQQAGAPSGWWIAVALADGKCDGEVYPSREEAVSFQRHDATWFAFVQLGPRSMSVCEAEGVIRWHREMYRVHKHFTDKDAPHGGLQVIPRLTMEDYEAQMSNFLKGRGCLALGYAREVS